MYYAFRLDGTRYRHDPEDSQIGSSNPFHTQDAAELAARHVSRQEVSFVVVVNVLEGTPDKTDYASALMSVFHSGNRFVPDTHPRNLISPEAVYDLAASQIEHAMTLIAQADDAAITAHIRDLLHEATADLRLVLDALKRYAE